MGKYLVTSERQHILDEATKLRDEHDKKETLFMKKFQSAKTRQITGPEVLVWSFSILVVLFLMSLFSYNPSSSSYSPPGHSYTGKDLPSIIGGNAFEDGMKSGMSFSEASEYGQRAKRAAREEMASW